MTAHHAKATHPVLVGLGIMLVAFNMRPALTTIGPLLNDIRAETGLTAAGAAVLTTLPVFCLGLACALGPWVIRRFGPDWGVLLAVVVVALGSVLRGLGGLAGTGALATLFLGACLAAAGIGLSGVLLPGLVKRDFPRHAGPMTGLYTMILCLGAATGAGIVVPMAHGLGGGWPLALSLWALPCLVAALVWAPLAMRGSGLHRSTTGRPPWRDRVAWQVTGFMGLQSSLAYIVFGWLPAVLQARGLSAVDAGFVTSIMSLGQAPSALLVPTLASRARDQRPFVVGLVVLCAAVFAGLALGPRGLVPVLAILLGVSLGGLFGLGLTIIVLRARNAEAAAGLSILSQGVGYTFASLGPLGFGLAHDASGGWEWPTALFVAIASGSLLCGLGAGRDRQVGIAPRRAERA
ncbi:MFS transporter [Methylobacterium sp. Leaf466]|uniref:CynX/NimT family MFS transporter n=1 Tax=Methylobacterium sp. Leaf466 TaxID=1736386 RepID=UPI0006F456CD|nr:MFS transporter [Methylobacterium sp. Leaf466]KQT84415.1 MFS transporter [Methylobacterium sp. Leaf466]